MESNLLNSGAGTGVLMSDGKPIPVAYDLIRSPDGAAEGQVFGEAKALEVCIGFEAGPRASRAIVLN
jgi:hypothetical protein